MIWMGRLTESEKNLQQENKKVSIKRNLRSLNVLEKDNDMKITNMTVNHLTNPVGYHMDRVTFHWLVEGSCAKCAASSRIRVASDQAMKQVVYDSGEQKGDLSGHTVNYDWEESTRYYWNAELTDDLGTTAVSETAYFETPKAEKDWDAKWIGSTLDGNGILYKDFDIAVEKVIQNARLSVTGVGLYEVYLNGKKVGDEYLSPNFNDYDNFIQFQTYELESYFRKGINHLEI